MGGDEPHELFSRFSDLSAGSQTINGTVTVPSGQEFPIAPGAQYALVFEKNGSGGLTNRQTSGGGAYSRGDGYVLSGGSFVTTGGCSSSRHDLAFQIWGQADFTITATGTCPGTFTFEVFGENPGGQIVFIYGTPGSFTQTGTPCNGTMVDITSPTIAQNSTSTTLMGTVPAGACGVIRVQAADVNTCSVSNFIDL